MIENLNAQNHSYYHFTVEDGLPTDYVYGVIEDDEGYIWAYTENGVAKYDGYNWKVFTTADGLPHNDVFHMLKDKDGRLWCRNIGKIPCFIENDSIHWPLGEKESHIYGKFWHGCAVSSAYLDLNPALLVFKGADTLDTIPLPTEVLELLKFTKDSVEYFLPSSFSRDQWTGVTMSRGYMELFKWNNGVTQFLNTELPASYIKKYSTNGISWTNIGQEGEIGLFNGDTSLVLHHWRTGFSRSISFIEELGYIPDLDAPLDSMRNGKSVFNTYKEYIFLNDSLVTTERFKPKAISDRFTLRRLFIDSESNRWIGTKEGGLFMIPQQHLKTEILPFDSKSKRIKSAFEELINIDGRVFTITDDLFIYEIIENELKFRFQAKGSQLRQASVLNKRILLANSSALVQLELNNGEFSIAQDDYPINKISTSRLKNQESFYQSKMNIKSFCEFQRSLWYSINGFTLKLDLSTGELFPFEIGNSRCFKVDPFQNKVLFEYGRKLKQVNNDEFETLYEFPDVISEIQAISSNEILVGTENIGLYVHRPDTTYLASTASYAKAIKLLGDTLYAATKDGLIQLNRNENGLWEESSRIDKLDGLPSDEVHDIEIVGRHIYGATYKGIFKFSIDHGIYAPSSNRTIEFTHIDLSGEALENTGKQKFESDYNDLQVSYHFNDYASNGDIVYSYRLNPIESQFRSSKERTAIYSGLSPGEYQFEIFAIDIYGQTYEQSMPINFEILAPFYARWWFRALSIATFLALTGTTIRRYMKRKEARLLVQERLTQRVGELQLESLRSQMNPHFIFNSLGSIQYYIQTNKVDEADHYLTLFAQLMREFLDSSVENMISLDKEIELLKKYTELESMRFDERFTVSFNVDEKIDLVQQEIPSMLIQPFIENAVNHGLRQREEGGQLEIQFNQMNDKIICMITDNGIGRKASKRNRLNQEHKSRAMQNIEDRIKVLEQSRQAQIIMEVNDYQSSSTYPGTKVKLTISKLNQNEEAKITVD